MKVTKQQKILGGVLILGAIALGMDRFVFPSPADNAANTEASPDYAVAPTPKPAVVAATAQNVLPQISISQRLRNAGEGLADSSKGRDAFAMPASWIAQPAPVLVADHAGDQFRQAHRLSGVLESATRGYAVVDGKIIGLGKTIDGFRLISISHRAAVFERMVAGAGNEAGERVTLTMSEKTADGTSNIVAGSEP